MKTIKKQGLRIWKNPVNEFTCVELHYTADPAKRSEEWKRKMSRGMDAKAWASEFELQWETYAGEPVFGKEFSRELHVYKEAIEPDPRQPTLVRGWDFGGNHSCAVMQLVGSRVSVLKEYANMGYNTRRIASDIVYDCQQLFGEGFRYVDVIDPSGLHEGKTSTGIACADVMRDLDLQVVPGVQDPSRRIDAAMQLMITMSGGMPNLMFNPECTMLINGAAGGWQYPEKETQNQKANRPIKNEYSHIWDALCYGLTRITSVGNYEVLINVDSGGGYRIM